MTTLHIHLSESTYRRLHQLAQRTGKSKSKIIEEALQQFIEQCSESNRLQLLRQACGMWKDRNDLSDVSTLRSEWDR
jgi:predicted transcriptional regulator